MKKAFILTTLFIFALIVMAPAGVFAGTCMECHHKYNVKVKVPTPTPIKMAVNGKVQSIGLAQAFQFHGHECPGITIAYRAVQHGMELLFPNEIPKREDLIITSLTPAGGVKDFLDLIMRGDNPANKTWPPAGMGKGRDRFVFTMLRKSTCEIVELRLNPDLIPEDFFPLKKKKQNQTITNEEDARLHAYIKKIVLDIPIKPASELFGPVRPRKIIVWGNLKPGEQDKNIRRLRQEEKKKALQNVQLENKKQEERI